MRVLAPGLPTDQVAAAVDAALAGGAPVAPLPADPVEAARVRAMLRPEVPVEESDAAVIVSTSGSTGSPKGVVLSRAAIATSAAATHRRLGGPGRWLLALPTHYVAGFMVVARAAVTGAPVDDVGTDLGRLPEIITTADTAAEPSYLSLVPTQLTRALDDPALTGALRRVTAILLGGAPAGAELLDRAASAGLRLLTTYGMSETCGGCVYDGTPLPGVRVELDDPGTDGVGRVLLGGPMIFSGYRLRPELTATTLIDHPRSPSSGNGAGGPAGLSAEHRTGLSASPDAGLSMVRTNDRGRIRGGRLDVLGRFDDVIISGGLKIDLASVERAAREWPGLAGGEIAVVGVPDRDWGSRLVAYAERGPHGDPAAPADLAALQDFLAGRIARHEQPRELIMMARLPRTSSGKVDRLRLGTVRPGTVRP